jgi:aryl-alcohol dehydrogenase-like predicted oxidoreductase
MSRALDIAVTPWGIVGSGILSGKYNADPGTKGRASARGQIDERSLGIAAEVVSVAEEIGASPTQVAIAWLLKGPANIIPLVGARTVEQWDENLGCLDVELTEDQMQRLNSISSISPGFPHDMLSQQSEGRAKRIDNHRDWSMGA